MKYLLLTLLMSCAQMPPQPDAQVPSPTYDPTHEWCDDSGHCYLTEAECSDAGTGCSAWPNECYVSMISCPSGGCLVCSPGPNALQRCFDLSWAEHPGSAGPCRTLLDWTVMCTTDQISSGQCR